MSSPNVQIQNLLRRYMREKDGPVSMDKIMENLRTPHSSPVAPEIATGPISLNARHHVLMSDPIVAQPQRPTSENPSSISDNVASYNFSMAINLQTTHLYNFKSAFEYIFDTDIADSTLSAQQEDLFEFESEFESDSNSNQDAKMEVVRSTNKSTNYFHELNQYLGSDGIFNNIYGAELVNSKWLLYGYIVSKIHKTFKKNILTDTVLIKSLHTGEDTGSVQAVLHHLFNASDLFKDIKIKWSWTSVNYTNVLYKKHKSCFVPLLKSRPMWDQVVLILNKLSEIVDRYSLLIHQYKDTSNARNQYLFSLIVAIRFTDVQSVYLLELPIESKWGTLEINIIGICALIYDSVYLTKYDIDCEYCVLVCSDKKRNINTSILIKKLIKILNESDTVCILSKELLYGYFMDNIKHIKSYPIEPIPAMQMVNAITGVLKYNETPLYY